MIRADWVRGLVAVDLFCALAESRVAVQLRRSRRKSYWGARTFTNHMLVGDACRTDRAAKRGLER